MTKVSQARSILWGAKRFVRMREAARKNFVNREASNQETFPPDCPPPHSTYDTSKAFGSLKDCTLAEVSVHKHLIKSH